MPSRTRNPVDIVKPLGPHAKKRLVHGSPLSPGRLCGYRDDVLISSMLRRAPCGVFEKSDIPLSHLLFGSWIGVDGNGVE